MEEGKDRHCIDVYDTVKNDVRTIFKYLIMGCNLAVVKLQSGDS